MLSHGKLANFSQGSDKPQTALKRLFQAQSHYQKIGADALYQLTLVRRNATMIAGVANDLDLGDAKPQRWATEGEAFWRMGGNSY